MRTTEEFLKSKEPNTYIFPVEWLKEYALEIASEAFDAGSAYAIGSHKDFKQTHLNKFEYSQKLHNEL